MEVVCWLLGVFNLGGLSEMELLMEEEVDGGGVHAVQMDLLIAWQWVGELMWGRRISHGAAWFVHVVNARMDRMWWVHEG